MFHSNRFFQKLFEPNSSDFESSALTLFKFQFENNPIYQQYCVHLNKTPKQIKRLTDIPFLPIEFFKTHKVVSGSWNETKIYKSSGTTSSRRSQHYVRYDEQYLSIAKYIFEQKYGPLTQYRLIALLPSYIDQGDSSLVSMIDYFMKYTATGSCYALNKTEEVAQLLKQGTTHKTLLFGVTYALLDLADQLETSLPSVMIFETGGMKGRRKEITRMELHQYLKDRLHPLSIHSEYGMTELSSQAYSNNLLFSFPWWCRALIRDINDPFQYLINGKTGGINIIDLANIHSCAFVETKDLGVLRANDQFEVVGRFDNSDIRGCNLLD